MSSIQQMGIMQSCPTNLMLPPVVREMFVGRLVFSQFFANRIKKSRTKIGQTNDLLDQQVGWKSLRGTAASSGFETSRIQGRKIVQLSALTQLANIKNVHGGWTF